MTDLQTRLENEHYARRDAYRVVLAHAENLHNARKGFAGPDDMADVLAFLRGQLDKFEMAPNE